jgi:hypothetical protein
MAPLVRAIEFTDTIAVADSMNVSLELPLKGLPLLRYPGDMTNRVLTVTFITRPPPMLNVPARLDQSCPLQGPLRHVQLETGHVMSDHSRWAQVFAT